MDLAMMTLMEAGYLLPPDPAPVVKASAIPTQPAAKGCCIHCGKRVGRGLHFHQKACKGVK